MEMDDLLALVAHEMRNPLHGLSLQVSLARGLCASREQTEIDRVLARLQGSLGRYSNRATLLLDLLRVRADTFPLAPRDLDLAALLRAVAEAKGAEARSRGIALELELPAACPVHTDPLVIEQIVENLLLNAFKHAACRSATLALRCDGEGGPQIDVRDDGRGIDPQDQTLIFGKFERASASGPGTGSGLGLWIVSRLAALLGARIALRSAPGQGSVFSIHLPPQVRLTT